MMSKRRAGLWILGLIEDKFQPEEISKLAYDIYHDTGITKESEVSNILYDLMLIEADDDFHISLEEIERLALDLIKK